MRKLLRRVLVCAVAAGIVWLWMLARDRKTLNEELIRFHVVANSDSEEDQSVKLRLRDAVMENLGREMAGIADVAGAEAYLRENLSRIESFVNETLRSMGVDMTAGVSLCREAFDKRVYDTFTLPAGVYKALRITIGEGEGKNWWCVVFPEFCLGAVGSFESRAVGAGFSEGLTDTLARPEDCSIRFFFLEKLGQLENRFFPG